MVMRSWIGVSKVVIWKERRFGDSNLGVQAPYPFRLRQYEASKQRHFIIHQCLEVVQVAVKMQPNDVGYWEHLKYGYFLHNSRDCYAATIKCHP